MKAQLAVDRMSDGALWRRVNAEVAMLSAYIGCGEMHPDQHAILSRLKVVLAEIETRGVQLRLLS